MSSGPEQATAPAPISLPGSPRRRSLWRRLVMRPPETWWMATYNCLFIVPVLAIAFARRPMSVSWTAAAGAFALGCVSWTLLEYLAHRWVFHLLFADDHGRHHDFPKEERYLHGPTFIVFFTWLTALVIYVALLGLPLGLFALAGLNLTYMGYELLHAAVHAGVAQRARWFRPTRAWHAAHHHDSTERGYGVTTPFWDWVFRTGNVRARFPRWLFWTLPLPVPGLHFALAGVVPTSRAAEQTTR